MRQFQKYISPFQWILLLALACMAIGAWWYQMGLLVWIGFTLLVLHLDRMLHSCYVVTPQEVRLRRSRFHAPICIPLNRVLRLERIESRQIFGIKRRPLLLLTYATDDALQHTREVYIDPKTPDEFVEFLRKKKIAHTLADNDTDDDSSSEVHTNA